MIKLTKAVQRNRANKNSFRDREQTINKDLMAHDEEIRDLMGVRDLYMRIYREVYDVSTDGATQKPYGRVFYTKGKALVSYAYDLDQQWPGLKTLPFRPGAGADRTPSRPSTWVSSIRILSARSAGS